MSERVKVNPEYAWTTKWWSFGGRFPLIPQWRFKPENEYNTSGFWFHWLAFRAWTMDSPDIGFQINLDDQQLELRIRLPYLITGLWIPLFPFSFHQKTWRKVRRPKRPPPNTLHS